MVESSEHRDCVNASLCLRGTWNRLLVRECLVRACVVVETHVLGDDASKMFLAEDAWRSAYRYPCSWVRTPEPMERPTRGRRVDRFKLRSSPVPTRRRRCSVATLFVVAAGSVNIFVDDVLHVPHPTDEVRCVVNAAAAGIDRFLWVRTERPGPIDGAVGQV